jgi:hypothetical protein
MLAVVQVKYLLLSFLHQDDRRTWLKAQDRCHQIHSKASALKGVDVAKNLLAAEWRMRAVHPSDWS